MGFLSREEAKQNHDDTRMEVVYATVNKQLQQRETIKRLGNEESNDPIEVRLNETMDDEFIERLKTDLQSAGWKSPEIHRIPAEKGVLMVRFYREEPQTVIPDDTEENHIEQPTEPSAPADGTENTTGNPTTDPDPTQPSTQTPDDGTGTTDPEAPAEDEEPPADDSNTVDPAETEVGGQPTTGEEPTAEEPAADLPTAETEPENPRAEADGETTPDSEAETTPPDSEVGDSGTLDPESGTSTQTA